MPGNTRSTASAHTRTRTEEWGGASVLLIFLSRGCGSARSLLCNGENAYMEGNMYNIDMRGAPCPWWGGWTFTWAAVSAKTTPPPNAGRTTAPTV
eukprot:7016792-Alexandrium_andersonii.AAC.1